MLIRSRAPVRICDIGGWTDTHFAEHGSVLNIAVAHYAHCILQPRTSRKDKHTLYGYKAYSEAKDNGAVIRAPDLDTELKIDDVRQIEYDGNLDLLKAAVKRLDISSGFDATLWTGVPPGSGVGTSAAVSVAMVQALARFKHEVLSPHDTARMAQRIETEELGLECGVQDQFAAAYGGICLMEVDYPDASVSRLDISKNVLHELEERLVLAYVGQSRLSDRVHRRVIERFRNGDSQVQGAFDTLRKLPHTMKEALIAGDFGKMAEVLNANWEAQKNLHLAITNDLLERVFDIALSSGAVAGKANGAGAGGSVTFLSEPGCEVQLREALAEQTDCQILPVHIDLTGVQSWEVGKQ